MQQKDKRHKRVLNKHLKDFFKFLETKPKPTNEHVRSEFLRHEAEWRIYCADNGLKAHLAELFNANVSAEWERRVEF